MLGIGIVRVDAGMTVRRGGVGVVPPCCCCCGGRAEGKGGGMGDKGDWGCGVDDCCDSRPDGEPATELTGFVGGCRW